MTVSRSFEKRLRMTRELRGLNQTELARKGGLPPSSIAHFEGGSRKPSFDNIGRLAEALDVSADYLLGRTDDPAFSKATDRLHRRISQLAASDREFGEDLIDMLVERNRAKKAREMEFKREIRYREIEKVAQEVLTGGNISSLPTPVLDIVHSHNKGNIAIADLDIHASGILMRAGDLLVINHDEPGKRDDFTNFGIAHELGHILLDGHLEHVLPVDGAHMSQANYFSADPFEREADHFASRLLMPEDLLRDRLADLQVPAGLETIETIAKLCEAPLAAAAIRYVELAEDAVAVIISSGMAVTHCRLSQKMKSLDGVACAKRGAIIPADSETAHAYADMKRFNGVKFLDEDADLAGWLGGDPSLAAREEAMAASYGRMLTVLTCSEDKQNP